MEPTGDGGYLVMRPSNRLGVPTPEILSTPWDFSLPSLEETPTAAHQGFDDAQSDPNPEFGLSTQQKKLHRELSRLQNQLGAMYLGGLRVLEDESNPDSLAQSANSMRELMDKITELRAMPVGGGLSKEAPRVHLKAKLREVEDRFLSSRVRTDCYSEKDGWSGQIDVHLRKLLDGLGAFFEWFASLHPRRREQFRRTLRRLDASGRDLPEPFFEKHRKEWEETRRFFLSVCHHRKRTDIRALRERIAALETFLVERLVPSTLDDLDAIDALLEEASDA
ncbi:MAG: hypothetical protein OXN92_00510 [Gammaproteobacteria bacterium]|nr:hypothetical protein [Gammaproteobacteria bacterium]